MPPTKSNNSLSRVSVRLLSSQLKTFDDAATAGLISGNLSEHLRIALAEYLRKVINDSQRAQDVAELADAAAATTPEEE